MAEQANENSLSLYLKLYFDEDVSIDIVNNLRTRGFDVICARDVGMLHRDDDAQLAFAVSQGRALVTHNRHDFEMRHAQYSEARRTHCGIIIARRRPRPSHVVSRLLDLLNRVAAGEMINQLRYV
ncbi:MAG: DUF5615 family PIN-like protein [Anaerolineae bacterium]|nr:DUF5615 family PIN-like protein [Anaerolineae bacterium]